MLMQEEGEKKNISEKLFLPLVGLLKFFSLGKSFRLLFKHEKAHMEKTYCLHCKITGDLW